MNFPLIQLYSMNRSKPIVEVEGIDGTLQWDTCDLEGLPPEQNNPTMTAVHERGRIPQGQWDNLPTTFFATNGEQYIIDNIHTLKSSRF